MGMMDGASQGTMYYPPSYYQQEYAAQAARAAQQAAVQTEQAVALRLLPQGQLGPTPAAPETQVPRANTEAAPSPADASANATATTPAAARTGESQTLPALHHGAAPTDAAVALDRADGDTQENGAGDRLALARLDAHDNESLAPAPESG
jgi:hypothetical protein